MAGRRVVITNDTDFMRQSGAIFVDELRIDAAHPKSSSEIRRDWAIIARWLQHTAGNLTASQQRKIEMAWIDYLSIGLAPSQKLQPVFDMFAQNMNNADKTYRAPVEVMDVFDRLLASDTDIEHKRAADLKDTKAQLQPFLDKVNKNRRRPWWRRQSSAMRQWIFAACVWATLMTIIFRFFDPFDIGGWDRMNGDEMIRFYLIALIPVAAGLIFYAYRKWVR